MSVTTRLRDAAVLPVVAIEDDAQALPLGQALLDAGITAIEITLRTPAGLSAITHPTELPGLTVGAGTVITGDELGLVLDAGAQFIVSPGFDPHLVGLAITSGILPIPGVATASEIMAAIQARLDVVKLFPAAQLGDHRSSPRTAAHSRICSSYRAAALASTTPQTTCGTGCSRSAPTGSRRAR
jgi:2-dehydro-3-deoxyphosphogluconate aldolase/(4S)-4-hydroxy-2-oxoglutarate aldolase